MEILVGKTLDPSMLTYNGNLSLVLVHGLLWWIPAIIIFASMGDLEKGQGDLEKRILTLYAVFSLFTPCFLVFYEIVFYFWGSYPPGNTIAQGFIFGLGYLTIGLATAATANLNDKDHLNMMVCCLFLTASGLGMFTAFNAMFVQKYSKADRALLAN